MIYMIRDLQTDQFFGGGFKFKSLKEICKALIDYHSIDCNMIEEKKLLRKGKIKECINALKGFEWEIIKIKRRVI